MHDYLGGIWEHLLTHKLFHQESSVKNLKQDHVKGALDTLNEAVAHLEKMQSKNLAAKKQPRVISTKKVIKNVVLGIAAIAAFGIAVVALTAFFTGIASATITGFAVYFSVIVGCGLVEGIGGVRKDKSPQEPAKTNTAPSTVSTTKPQAKQTENEPENVIKAEAYQHPIAGSRKKPPVPPRVAPRPQTAPVAAIMHTR